MSMTKDAVQHIQESGNIPAIIKQVSDQGTQIPVAIVPESMNGLSLEKYMEYAARYRQKYKTTSIEDFIAYNEKFDVKGATCFVNAEDMDAKSIFDLGTTEQAGHKEHTAILTLKKTAAFKALCNINGRQLGQKDAAEFIEDWADNIKVFTKAGDSMTAKAAAKSLQDLTIEAAREVNSKVSDFGESMSAMERIEAKNQDTLPAEINCKCLTYQGLTTEEFTLRVGVLTSGEKPKLVLRILQLEAKEEEIAEEFKAKLVSAFEKLEVETFIGEA